MVALSRAILEARGMSRRPPVSRAERRDATSSLLLDAAESGDPARRERLIAEVVEINMCVAEALAARYRGRGLASEDLQQVAYLALLKAARRFDVGLGHDFLSFAVPTIRGELRRYFRDAGWTVRPPRRLQEIQGRIVSIEAELTQTLGRSPSVREIAEGLAEPPADVAEALAAEGCFAPDSLDRPVCGDSTATTGDRIGVEDDSRGPVEARIVLTPLVRGLDAREKTVLRMRFFDQCTQREIAQELGVTQTQVSRLLRQILGDLREALPEDAAISC